MATIALHFKDAAGKPVPGVTLSFYEDTALINLLQVPATGTIYFDSAADYNYLNEYVTIKATAPGYTVTQTDGGRIAQYTDFTYTMEKTGLNKALVAGAALALAAAAAFTRKGKKRKSVSGFNELPPAAQTAIVFGGLGLGVWFLFFKNKNPGDMLPKAADLKLKELAAAGIYPNTSGIESEAMASNLRIAFNDCGTDWDAVVSTMQRMTNDADIWQLVKVYGTRGYKGCFDGDYFGMHEYNLQEAMTAELSKSDLATINDLLRSNGITFKF